MCRVAIAEDTPEVMDIMVDTCEKGGHTIVAQVEDFRQLKSWAKTLKGKVDCILLDTTLPYSTLEGSLNFLRRALPKTKVLLVGNGIKKGTPGYYEAVIEKPIISRVVRDAIRDVTKGPGPLKAYY